MVAAGQVEFGQLLEHLHVHAGLLLVVDQVTRQQSALLDQVAFSCL